MADVRDLKSLGSDTVPVQVRYPAPIVVSLIEALEVKHQSVRLIADEKIKLIT